MVLIADLIAIARDSIEAAEAMNVQGSRIDAVVDAQFDALLLCAAAALAELRGDSVAPRLHYRTTLSRISLIAASRPRSAASFFMRARSRGRR
jgi:hypothetical protein